MAVRQMRLNAAVLVCFSDSNMVHVAALTKGSRRYVFADNDKSGAGERAAKETGLPYCMSPTLGEDANDLHKREGLVAVPVAQVTDFATNHRQRVGSIVFEWKGLLLLLKPKASWRAD